MLILCQVLFLLLGNLVQVDWFCHLLVIPSNIAFLCYGVHTICGNITSCTPSLPMDTLLKLTVSPYIAGSLLQ